MDNKDNKNKFQEMLREILEIARVQGNQLGMNEIRNLFGNLNLREAQYEHIFAYLAANHIKVRGYTATESEYTQALLKESQNTEDTDYGQDRSKIDTDHKKQPSSHIYDEDSAYLEMYLEDLKAIKESTYEEEIILINKILKGDDFAKKRYIEANLHNVVKIAADYKNQGVSMEDLIQEGNIGLISSMEMMSEVKNCKQGKEMALDFIRKYMEAAIAEQKENSSFEDSIVEKINHIREGANELAKDLGRKANIQELAGYIKIPVEEIEDMLRIAADGIKLNGKDERERS